MEGPYFDRQYELGPLQLAPLTPLIGAMVSGIDLRRQPSLPDQGFLREALRRHKVLFFRGQELSVPEFVAFGRCLSRLQSYALGTGAGGGTRAGAYGEHPEVRVFDYGECQRGREAFWHFDVLPSREPAPGAVLRARIVPEVGGDTLFCDLAAIYDSLPDTRKDRLDTAVGVYDFVVDRHAARLRGKPEAEVMAIAPGTPLDEIPLVRRRPDGGKALLLNPAFLLGIKDRPGEESRELIADLRARIARPEMQCRFRWQPGDIAFWDNRACLHYATNNYWPERRIMERLTLLDDLYEPPDVEARSSGDEGIRCSPL